MDSNFFGYLASVLTPKLFLLTFSLAEQLHIHTAAKLATVASFASVLIVGMNNLGEGVVDIIANTITGIGGCDWIRHNQIDQI